MTEKIIPDGYKLVAVKGLDELVYWLDRCKDKGHLENCADLIEPFEAFEYRNVSEEAVIAAHEAKAAPAVPQGWKLVPVEPTPEMLAAVSWPGCARTDWSHMLAATPAAPSQPVTLTDEEIGDLARPYGRSSINGFAHIKGFARAIIAALREKDGGA